MSLEDASSMVRYERTKWCLENFYPVFTGKSAGCPAFLPVGRGGELHCPNPFDWFKGMTGVQVVDRKMKTKIREGK